MPVDGYLNFDTKIDTGGFDDGLKDVDKHVKTFSSSLDGLGKKIKAALDLAAVAAFGKALIDAAADVKAAGSQFEQTFGEMQDAAEMAIDRVAEPADILAERLKGSAASIFAFAKTAKMETSTAMRFMEDSLQVAADSAAYYDRSIEQTTETLQSFLKGNYANDAALGLSATETTRNAKAMELYGKKFIDLSEAQKQLTLLEMVKDANKLSGAMGQAAREADGWANVTGNLSEGWHQFLGVVGQPVLALAVPVVQHMTAALEKMTAWANAAYTAMAQVFGWEQKQVKPIQQAASAQGDLTAAVEETEEAQEGSLASFDEIETLAAGAAEATEKSAESAQITAGVDMEALPTEEKEVDTGWIDTFTAKLQELKNFIDTHIKPTLSTVGESLKLGFDGFGEFLDTNVKPALSAVGESLKLGFDGFGEFLDTELKPLMSSVGESLIDGLSGIGEYIDTNVKPKLEEIPKNYDLTFSVILPTGLTEMFAPVGEWFRVDLPQIVTNAIGTAVGMLDPLARWFTTNLPGFVQSGIQFIAATVSGLLDTFSTVFNDIWTLVVDPFFMTFVENILPVFTELGTELFKTLTVVFEEVKRAFDMVWNDGIKPVLEFIGKAWSDFWTLAQQKWEQWGAPIFEQLRTAFQNTGDLFEKVWTNTLKPVWEQFMGAVNRIWKDYVMPFLSGFLDLVGKLIHGALRIYNEFILPFVGWLDGIFSDSWKTTQKLIIDTWEAITSNIFEQLTAVTKALGGLIDFIVGVFTGDWELAWQGIKDFFGGIWDGIVAYLKQQVNSIIAFLNAMIDGVVSGFNAVIRALNRIQVTIPDWVPGFGGKSFGINLSTITAPRIPYLASGAVIPPNREFLAVLGDQTQGTNIEAPLETILEAMRTALRENGGGRGQQTVILQIDKREFGRAVIETGSEEEHRIGLKLVTA